MDEVASVLIVDDNKAIRDYLISILEIEGYQVFSASDGEETLKFLHEHSSPDLILLDIIMPGMNGIDVLRTIKGDPVLKQITIIMLTSVSLTADKELAFQLGASDYLTKPFELRELLARVKTHINLKKTTDECALQRKIQETILSTIPGIVYLKSKDGYYIHGNEMFADLVGIPLIEIPGKREEDLFSSYVADERIKADDLLLKFGVEEFEIQEEISMPDKSARSFFTKKRRVVDKNGEITGLVGVSIDITEQVILKEAYAEKEEILDSILNSYPAEIWVLNPNGEIILQNSKHLAKYGNLIGRPIPDLPLSEETKIYWKESLDLILNGKIRENEKKIIESDGSEWIIDSFRPIRLQDGILGIMGMNLNVTRWSLGDDDLSIRISGESEHNNQNSGEKITDEPIQSSDSYRKRSINNG
ncbi:response regulator [Methanospirillum lacunae]|uniref:Histidine kinase n=1 Tax=Methanospirillum lacunae TaxID=668570 RepID=A0A2V2N290_9EURY|nr:response regulator [Methanospirillum lacunae]PWR74222.1 hypothetical protein DK846_03470 [Methanospirillum lacunae]